MSWGQNQAWKKTTREEALWEAAPSAAITPG